MYDLGYKTITTSNVFFTKFLELLVYYAGTFIIVSFILINLKKYSNSLPRCIVEKLNYYDDKLD